MSKFSYFEAQMVSCDPTLFPPLSFASIAGALLTEINWNPFEPKPKPKKKLHGLKHEPTQLC